MTRIVKFVYIATATMVAGYDICNNSALAGLNKAIKINKLGWVGSDAAYDTKLELQDGQVQPVTLYNQDTVANGLDFSKHIHDLNFVPESGDIQITVDVNLGAGDAVIFVDAYIP